MSKLKSAELTVDQWVRVTSACAAVGDREMVAALFVETAVDPTLEQVVEYRSAITACSCGRPEDCGSGLHPVVEP